MVSSADKLIANIELYVIDPLIGLLFALALIMFVWGLAQLILNSESEDGRTIGKRHMLWGIVGMFVMISVYAIINVLGNTFGF